VIIGTIKNKYNCPKQDCLFEEWFDNNCLKFAVHVLLQKVCHDNKKKSHSYADEAMKKL